MKHIPILTFVLLFSVLSFSQERMIMSDNESEFLQTAESLNLLRDKEHGEAILGQIGFSDERSASAPITAIIDSGYWAKANEAQKTALVKAIMDQLKGL